jgi:hypothetical protein
VRDGRIQPFQRRAEIADQNDFARAAAAKSSGRAEGFLVVTLDGFPAKDIAQVVREGLLNQAVFAVDVGDHGLFC